MLAAARRQQRNAWNAFRDQRPRLALKLTLMARETGRRAVRWGQGLGPQDPARAERELTLTDRLLQEAERVLERGEGREGLPPTLNLARRIQAQAWAQARAGRAGLALRLTRQARRMVSGALGRTDVAPLRGEIQAMIGTTAELIDRLFQDAAEAGQSQAIRRLTRAENLLEEAQAAFRRGEFRQAVGAIRTASALALDVSESLEHGPEE
jgi:hypothetical protein